MDKFHEPVMRQEVMAGLAPGAGGRYIDATVGGGGLGEAIIRRGGLLLGIDADPAAIEYTKRRFTADFGQEKRSWTLVQGNFRDIWHIADREGFGQSQGIVFDLGVSSYQLDTPEKGFSYRFAEAKLDLRFNQESGESAAELINHIPEEEMYEIFEKFGEEQLARPLVRAVVSARKISPINSAGQLAAIVRQVAGDDNQALSRVFQALRIAVNDELDALKRGLSGSQKLLVPGGRLAVLSYHSLEDRIVKLVMRQPGWQPVNKKPILPSAAEVAKNRRARSAKLRIAEKVN